MGSLAKYILSVLFPPRLDAKLTHEELHATLDFRTRDSRHQNGIVWSSSAGNVREHPAKPELSIRERRRRDLSNDVVLSIGDRVFIERIR